MRFKYILLLLFLFSLQNIIAQLSKKHFIPPLTSGDGFSDQYIYISTPKNSDVAFKITPVGNPDIAAYSGVVSNGNPVSQPVLNFSGGFDFDDDSQLHMPLFLANTVLKDRGFIIEAEDVVYVSVRVRSSFSTSGQQFHAGALVSKGNSALGLDFRIGGFIRENNGNNDTTFASFMATEDNTTVTISDLNAGISIFNYFGSLPITVNLNEGESYIIVTRGINSSDLIGGLISGDKPIVVNSGSAIGSFGFNTNNSDYGFDQIVDATKIGTEYILVKGAGTVVEKALIIAHENNTQVSINGQVVSTLNAGNYYVTEEAQYNANGNMYVNTSKPVFVYQGIGGIGNNGTPSQANQGMFFVPPLSCENKGDVNNIADIDRIGNDFFDGGITIVTNIGATITINENPISNFNSFGPFTVTGNANYVTYRVTGLTGNINVQSDQELYCAYFNQNGAATTGSFYSGFPSAPEINFDTTVSSLGNCIPNLTLEAANTDLFDSFKWEYFNEATNTWVEKSTLSTYKPIASEPGIYRLIGSVDCTGATFISVEIPVSICPDDFDGDLIIDNIDIDIDNDGILNCDESIGNADLDLSDIANPSLIFKDNTTNSTIISSSFTTSDPLNSFTSGRPSNFLSTLQSGSSSSSVYELNFTQNVNILFTQDGFTSHNIVAGEYFSIKVAPNDKNITLLDPDDQLLIDSNFDGEYETGIVNFSASEIRFKYKNNLADADFSFTFLANQVRQVTFEHGAVGISSGSNFAGFIQLTCFSLDTDGDGIEDMFDADTDNDGIPDILEAAATKITLLNTDANQDGLDDAFNGIITNIDSDADGIVNSMDVDADNDGIFDLVEANHGKTDANNDGIIDNANSTNVGINGMLNTLETTPDSKILTINYTPTDTDADDVFNFIEKDADNDDCFDVIEAGFTDANTDGFLDGTPFAISANGQVINNADGYTPPNTNYTTSAPITLNIPFEDVVFCEDFTDSISIDSTADSFQWEVSTDGITWSTINNNARYTGATTNTLQITNTPIGFNNYKYRVLLNRTGNSCGKTSNEITLTLNAAPVVAPTVNLLQCDTDLDRISTVNLTEAEISISSNYQNETFQYFETQANAIAGTPEVADKLRYPVNITGTAWARTINKNGCFRISEIQLLVEAASDVAYDKEFPAVCDDFLQADGTDGLANSDTDGISNFNFSAADNEILAFFPISLRPNLEISYFETQDDRTTVINEITDIANYRNTNYPSNITRQTIYFKITNKNNNDCSGTGELYLKTNSVPMANPVDNLELCDNNDDGNMANGIVQTFDLESQTTNILGTQSSANFTVTYHLSAADANTGNNALTSPFENLIPNSQTIFVRVTNTTTGCFTDHTNFNVIVNTVPEANAVANLPVCDDNADGDARNGFSQAIDLESQTAAILGAQNPSNFTVTYHISLSDAASGNLPLSSPHTNRTQDRETIFVRVFNETTFCANSSTNFDVIINSEPTFEVISDVIDCDDDADGDDTNGRIQSLDFTNLIPSLLGVAQNPNDFNVTFHTSQNEANTGLGAISFPYENTTATQTIFVRIQHKTTLCVNDDASFNIRITPLPAFEVTTPQIICLNILPLNIKVENEQGTYTYVWRNPNGNEIGNFENVAISAGGLYSVTATATDGTGCQRTRFIQVDESEIATLTLNDITVIDDAANNSISINTTNQNLGIGTYQYALFDENGDLVRNYQDENIFENLDGGIFTLKVQDKNGCGTTIGLEIPVVVFPKFFTPNNDGINDTWKIIGAASRFFPTNQINVFNRFGKLIGEITLDTDGWDGTFNGKLLPEDDYWYSIKLINTNGELRERIGNFSLVRE